jgi:hypothetical protein
MNKKIPYLLIAVLIVIILLQRCGGIMVPLPQSKTDTVVEMKYDTVIIKGKSKPVFIKGERDTIIETETKYILSKTDSNIAEKFDTLVQLYSMKNIYRDSVKIDTFGYITLTDTVQQNKFLGRSFTTNIVIPEKTVTITKTIYPKPTRQFYIGGGISGNKTSPINSVNAGLLYKDRRDRIFGIGASYDGQINFGIQSYWKIKL